MSIIETIDSEIKQSVKNEKPIYIQLFKDEFTYKGVSSTKVEGEYFLTAKGVEANTLVSIKYDAGVVSVSGLDECQEKMLDAYLLKNSAAILTAVKQKLNRDELAVKPAFLVGPPGTGKSTVIVNAIKESIKTERILVLSPTHMAVENVFERLDLDSLGLEEGEIILNINTENESLKAYHSDVITGISRTQIADEQEILKSAKDELNKKRRDAETIVYDFKNKIEQEEILEKNISNDIAQIEDKIKKEKLTLKELEKRLALIESNSILNSISALFTSGNHKADEIKNSICFSKKQIEIYESSLFIKKDELNSISKIDKVPLATKEKELKEINDALKQVNDRLKELDTQIEGLNSANIYKKARLVGVTLVSAATNQKLQVAEFDKIIIDEASMALFPYILSASQCLSNTDVKVIKVKHNEKLTEAQNRGVDLLVNNKLTLIGDPRQLSPIAVTAQMRETIFDKYQVERIFDGETVPNSVMLDINFRNHPHIVKLASEMFYGGKLKSGKEDNGLKSLFILKNKSPMTPFGGSFINYSNAELVVKQVIKALEKGRRSIGIVTPYKQQASLINKKLEDIRAVYQDADISAGTIHKFQGKEKDIIIFDICFAATADATVPKAYEGGIKSEVAKLLNVAMTRAETFFILIGDTEGIKSMKEEFLLKDWISEIEKL
ncbi:DEAD/DEAH box helicase [Aliarcobacter butzleri]